MCVTLQVFSVIFIVWRVQLIIFQSLSFLAQPDHQGGQVVEGHGRPGREARPIVGARLQEQGQPHPRELLPAVQAQNSRNHKQQVGFVFVSKLLRAIQIINDSFLTPPPM